MADSRSDRPKKMDGFLRYGGNPELQRPMDHGGHLNGRGPMIRYLLFRPLSFAQVVCSFSGVDLATRTVATMHPPPRMPGRRILAPAIQDIKHLRDVQTLWGFPLARTTIPDCIIHLTFRTTAPNRATVQTSFTSVPLKMVISLI